MPYDVSFVFLIEREFLMPGMVDTHLHAPQYAFCGTRVGLPLLEWLDQYTFPIEAKYKDTHFAEEIYSKVVVSDQLYYQVFPTEFSHNTESWQLWHLIQMLRTTFKECKGTYFSPNPNVHTHIRILGENELYTGRERLIRSHSSARFCFELSGNSN